MEEKWKKLRRKEKGRENGRKERARVREGFPCPKQRLLDLFFVPYIIQSHTLNWVLEFGFNWGWLCVVSELEEFSSEGGFVVDLPQWMVVLHIFHLFSLSPIWSQTPQTWSLRPYKCKKERKIKWPKKT